MLHAQDVMQKSLLTISKDATISEAIKILAENGITGLPVVDDDMKLLGLVSEKDLLIVAYHILTGVHDSNTDDKRIEEIMTTDVTSFSPASNIADVCQCFISNPFRRVPIVEDEKLVGLISRKDIICETFKKI